MNNRPIHFEIQADDAERAKKFYENALGWKIEKANMPEGNIFGLLQPAEWQAK